MRTRRYVVIGGSHDHESVPRSVTTSQYAKIRVVDVSVNAQAFTLNDHSKVVPLLPIPNRTVKRFSADDSAGSRVKVGHRQAFIQKTPFQYPGRGFLLCAGHLRMKTQKLLP